MFLDTLEEKLGCKALGGSLPRKKASWEWGFTCHLLGLSHTFSKWHASIHQHLTKGRV